MKKIVLLGLLSMSSLLMAGQPLDFETDVTPANCTAGQLGTMLVTVTGGTAPYTVDVIAPVPPSPPVQDGGGPDFLFENLVEGDYSVTVTDSSVPAQIVNKDVSVGVSTLEVESVATTPSNCSSQGANDGSISIAVVGGIPQYTFALDGGAPSAPQDAPFFDFLDLAPGNYTVTVVDSNLCSRTVPVVVDSTTLSINSVTTRPSNCSSPITDDGSITINAGGGVSEYRFSLDGGPLSAPQVVPFFEYFGVASGPHTVAVEDANLCRREEAVVVDSSTLDIALPVTTTPSNCSSPLADDGSITVTALGGIPQYTFAIDGGAPSDPQDDPTFDFFDVAAGNHTVAVTDANLCRREELVQVDSSTLAIEQPIETTPANCSSPVVDDGSITVTALGGIPQYAFAIDGGPLSAPQDSATFNFLDLASGDHAVAIEDGNLCRREDVVAVGSSDLAIDSVETTLSNCAFNGSVDGTIEVVALGTAAPFIFDLSNGATSGPQADLEYTFENLPADGYTVTVTDGNNCSRTALAVVDFSDLEIASVVTTPSNCESPLFADGTIAVDVVDGEAPYTFVLDGGAPQDSPLFEDVAAGPHTVTVVDGNGCMRMVDVGVVNSDLGIAVAGTTPSNCSSPVAVDGTITVLADGTAAPFTFNLSNGDTSGPQADPVYTFENIAAGAYVVSVVDSNDCSRRMVAEVGSSDLALTESTIPSQCVIGTGGIISVLAVGGETPFTFALDGGTPSDPQDERMFVFPPVPAGDYTVTVVDGIGCSRIIDVSVSTSSLQAITSSTPSSCSSPGAQDGTVTVDVSGGLPPYTVQVGDDVQIGEPDQVQFVFDGLDADIYDVTVTDTVPCQRIGTVEVEESTLGFTTETIPQTSPAGGVIKVTVTGGASSVAVLGGQPMPAVVADPFVVTVGDQTQVGTVGQTEFTFSGLQFGEYKVTCSDEFGCVRSRDILLLSDNDIANFILIKYCSTGSVN